jgi:hypothetical protein
MSAATLSDVARHPGCEADGSLELSRGCGLSIVERGCDVAFLRKKKIATGLN